MLYQFRCSCGARFDRWGTMNKPPRRARCKACGKSAVRDFNSSVPYAAGVKYGKPLHSISLGVPKHCIEKEKKRDPRQEFDHMGRLVVRETRDADRIINRINQESEAARQ